MKMNLKKVGAIVAGAAILASSVAFAGLYYQSTELVDQNGQPLVKVVVGEKAQASDGVAAANIAAKIANSAYAGKTLTAAVPDDLQGNCSAGNNTSGTCTISNEKVTLEVTVPGATVSGVYDFTTLIGDYLDRKLKNRVNTGDEDRYLLTVSEVNDNANPYTVGDTVNGDPLAETSGDEQLYKIDGDKFSPFKTTTVTDSTSGDQYTEYQNIYVEGTVGLDSDHEISTSLNEITYQVKFDNSGNYGIPRCSEETDDNWANCDTTDNEYIGAHRVQVDFLGSKWVIIDMTPPNTDLESDSEVVEGGSVTLAKESVHGVVPIGETLTSSDGNLQIRLDDIALQTGPDNAHPAIVSILDKNGNVLKQDQIDPGTTQKETVNGVTYKVRVYKTAPGYTMGAKWAEMALIEDELELNSGDELDSPNDDWKVVLAWKNKDASADAPDPDHLRSILLIRNSFDDDLKEGGSVDVITDPVAYKLTFKGLDLTSDDYDTLRFYKKDSTSLTVKNDGHEYSIRLGDHFKIESSDTNAFSYESGSGKYIYTAELGDALDIIDSNIDVNGGGGGVDESAFDINSDGNIDNDDDGYILADDGTVYQVINGLLDVNHDGTVNDQDGDGTTTVTLNGVEYDIIHGYVQDDGAVVTAADVPATITDSLTSGGVNDRAFVLVQEAPSSNKYLIYRITDAAEIDYSNIGELATAGSGGYITVEPANANAFEFDVVEDAGKLDADEHAEFVMQFRYNGDQFESMGGDDGAITVAGDDFSAFGYSAADADEGELITPRGSEFQDISSTQVKFKMARKIGNALFEFATAEAAETGGSTEVLTLKEGEEGKVGDVTIKVKSIDEDVGPCTAAGSATCVIPADSVKAVIMPDNVESLEAIVPYTLQDNLVVLDKDVSAAGTNLLITVGGPAVNTVTADALSGDPVDFNTTPVVVKKVGNKIVVAGLTAKDTMTAADNFVKSLTTSQ